MTFAQAIARVRRLHGSAVGGNLDNQYAGTTGKVVPSTESGLHGVEVHDRRGVGHSPTNPNAGTYRTTYGTTAAFDSDYAA